MMVMKSRLKTATIHLDRELNERIPNAELVREFLNEIDGCSAAIREYIE
jgi:hypothetical protein